MQKIHAAAHFLSCRLNFFAKYGLFMNKSWIFIAFHENSCYTETYSTFLQKG